MTEEIISDTTAKKDYERKIKENFLESYVQFATDCTDAPKIYHEFIAYALLSTICNHKVFLSAGYGKIYPNLWIILLGQSSHFRKSTSLSLAENILNQIDGNHETTCEYIDGCPERNNPNHIHTSRCIIHYTCQKNHYGDFIMPNDFSKEALFSKLSKRPKGIFLYSEFSSLIDTLRRDYNIGTQSFFTDIFDNPHKRERELRGETFTIIDPYINIVSATTVNWFITSCREEQVKGGFLARFLYINGEKDKIIPFPLPQDEQKKRHIIALLNGIKNSGLGETFLSAESKDLYEEWYMGNEKTEVSDLLAPIFARYDTYVLKLAMLNAVNNNRTTISWEDMQSAITKINTLKDNIKILFEEQMAFSWIEKKLKGIESIIKKCGKIQHSELLCRSNLDSKQFQKIITTLLESDKIIRETEKTGGKPKVFYKVKPTELN